MFIVIPKEYLAPMFAKPTDITVNIENIISIKRYESKLVKTLITTANGYIDLKIGYDDFVRWLENKMNSLLGGNNCFFDVSCDLFHCIDEDENVDDNVESCWNNETNQEETQLNTEPYWNNENYMADNDTSFDDEDEDEENDDHGYTMLTEENDDEYWTNENYEEETETTNNDTCWNNENYFQQLPLTGEMGPQSINSNDTHIENLSDNSCNNTDEQLPAAVSNENNPTPSETREETSEELDTGSMGDYFEYDENDIISSFITGIIINFIYNQLELKMNDRWYIYDNIPTSILYDFHNVVLEHINNDENISIGTAYNDMIRGQYEPRQNSTHARISNVHISLNDNDDEARITKDMYLNDNGEIVCENIDSSFIKRVILNLEYNYIDIEMYNSDGTTSIYRYKDIPADDIIAFEETFKDHYDSNQYVSIGRYYNENIKNKYSWELI